MSTFGRLRRRRRDERGDSLIEVLFAVVIIALAAGPLIGALLESIAASAEHRGLATADTLLKSFAETAVSEIETSPLPKTTTTTGYQVSTTPSYRLLSNPSKMSGPAVNTAVTVFVTGFPSASSFTIHVGNILVGTIPVGTHTPTHTATTYGNGDARITFKIPGGLGSTTLNPITVTTTTGARVKSLKGTGFEVTTSGSGSTMTKTPYRAYEIEVASVKCWTTTTTSFTACSTTNKSSGLQLLTFSAKGPSGTLGTLGVVVRDPNQP